jgi:hypothetical protein
MESKSKKIKLKCPTHGESYLFLCSTCRDLSRLKYAILPDIAMKIQKVPIIIRCGYCQYEKLAFEMDAVDRTLPEPYPKEAMTAYHSVKVHMGRKHKALIEKYEFPKIERRTN